LLAFLAAGFLALGVAGVAEAAVLNWSGTLTQSLADYPGGVLRGGGVATINGSSAGIPAHLQTLRLAGSRGQIGGNMTVILTDPETAANGLAAFVYEGIQGQTGTIGGISGGAASTSAGPGGVMAFPGLIKICLLSTECTQFLPLQPTQPTTVNGVPGTGVKGIGVGGLITVGGYGGIRISLQCGPWTVKTETVIDQITTPGGSRVFTPVPGKGWAHAPVSTTTSTAQPGGMLQLVSPAQAVTNLPLGSNAKQASFTVVIVEFIPEPGLLLLLGSGVAGLGILARRRWRK
jgi:hypothetical protein